MNEPIAALFDMDGVLVDNHEYHYQAWLKFGERHNKKINKEDFMIFFGSSAKEALRWLFGRDLSAEEKMKYASEKETIYREIYKPHLKPVKGVIEFIRKLKAGKIRIAIATSAPMVNVEFVIHELGIENIFDQVVHDAHFKFGKPDPEVYLKASEMLKISPSRCLVFEDSLPGIEAARRAGMKVIGVATTHPPEMIGHTDKVIKDFDEIKVEDLFKIVNA